MSKKKKIKTYLILRVEEFETDKEFIFQPSGKGWIQRIKVESKTTTPSLNLSEGKR